MGLIKLGLKTLKYTAVIGGTVLVTNYCSHAHSNIDTKPTNLTENQFRTKIVEMYKQSDKKYDNGTRIMLDILKEEGLDKGRMLYDKLKPDNYDLSRR